MKKYFIYSLIVFILFSSNTTSFAEGEITIWNITRGKGYSSFVTIEDIKEINNDVRVGNEFGKRISGKLVNFNSYYDKLVEKYMQISKVENDEDKVISDLVSRMENIILNLEDIDYDTKPILKNGIINDSEINIKDNEIVLNLDNYDIINSMNFSFNHPVRIKELKIDGRKISVEKHKDKIEKYFGIKDVDVFNKEIVLVKPLLNIKEIINEFGTIEIEVENESYITTKFLVFSDKENKNKTSISIEQYLPQFFQ